MKEVSWYSRYSVFIWHLTFCIALSLLSGCRVPEVLERSETGGVRFDDLRVEYEFDQPMRRLSRGYDTDPQSIVDHDVVEPISWSDQWSLARLEIECPHPSGRTDVARVTLTLSRPKPNGPGVVQERRMLAVPRQQVDLLILDLARAGCFDDSLTSTGEARLKVRIDRGQADRSWKSDERLLDFAHRTLTRGALLKQSSQTARSTDAEAGRGLRPGRS